MVKRFQHPEFALCQHYALLDSVRHCFPGKGNPCSTRIARGDRVALRHRHARVDDLARHDARGGRRGLRQRRGVSAWPGPMGEAGRSVGVMCERLVRARRLARPAAAERAVGCRRLRSGRHDSAQALAASRAHAVTSHKGRWAPSTAPSHVGRNRPAPPPMRYRHLSISTTPKTHGRTGGQHSSPNRRPHLQWKRHGHHARHAACAAPGLQRRPIGTPIAPLPEALLPTPPRGFARSP